MNTVEDLLAGGAPACKFETMGIIHGGRVTAVEARQQTDYDSGKPLFYDDGNPMMQIVVDLDTDERNPAILDDDGARRLYVRGQMLSATRAAVKKAGVRSLEPGGTLRVTYVGDGEAKNARFHAPKLYQVEYHAPSEAAAVEQVLAPAQPQAQAHAPAAVTASPQVNEAKIAQLRAMGYSPEQIAQLNR